MCKCGRAHGDQIIIPFPLTNGLARVCIPYHGLQADDAARMIVFVLALPEEAAH